MAAGGWPDWRVAGWIVLAMIGARSAAMGWNRLVDRSIDKANPRTAMRALPAGMVTPGFVALFVAVSVALLVVAAWRLNPLALKLSPLAIAILFGYSYTKRFTWASHLVLGLSLAGAPLGAWIAVRGDVTPTPLLLGLAVLLWVAGFDILYALQDLDFDRTSGLYSIPAKFGTVGSLWISGVLHAAMLGALALLPRAYSLGPRGLGSWYWFGWGGCALLIAYQHWVVRPRDLSRLNAAFFTANGALSVWLFGWTALDILLP
jgi:4-hydroxybenzoate polyprenyltransferase